METSTLASAIAIASSITSASEILKRLPRSKEVKKQIQRTELELTSSLERIRTWQQNWSSQSQHASVPEGLWGVQAWARIQKLLDDILETSTELQSQLREIQQKQGTRPDASWWERVIALVERRPSPELQPCKDIRDLARCLDDSVDLLLIWSETCFDSLHGLTVPESELRGRDELLRSSVGSRLASLELYSLCLAQTEDCSLEMDLRSSNALEPCYRLVAEPKENELRKLTVTIMKGIDIPNDELGAVAESSGSDLHLFKPSWDPRFIKLARHYPNSQHYLQIAAEQPDVLRLPKSPERLADILQSMKGSPYEHTEPYLSMKAKFELAFKVVESGFFLLGTPFFASLSSKTLRRVDNGTHRRLSFMLRIPALALEELVADDLGAVAESAQFLRISVILMDIALEGTDHDLDLQTLGKNPDAVSKLMSKLGAVEGTMGTTYCKAAAFCLQYDCGNRFSGLEKYDKERYGEWVIYLSGILKDYYAQVYLSIVCGDMKMDAWL